LVEGRILLGTLLVSMATVVLIVILGLRDLDGTLGGSGELDTLLISAAFIAFILVTSLYSFTRVLSRGTAQP
jgi:hypothetical protein